MRCVWASQPDNDHHCPARIPRGVVAEAWWHERRDSGVEEGFFRFLWNGREWLGYGVSDGRVRGVYCPVHTAERDTRAPRARELEGRTCVRALDAVRRWETAPLPAGAPAPLPVGGPVALPVGGPVALPVGGPAPLSVGGPAPLPVGAPSDSAARTALLVHTGCLHPVG
jgi:hypothetical protein